LAGSDGWSWNGPSEIHRVAPFTDWPRPGISTSTSATADSSISGYAMARNVLTGSREASHMPGRPIATQSACFWSRV
jgi:hypothetical protein